MFKEAADIVLVSLLLNLNIYLTCFSSEFFGDFEYGNGGSGPNLDLFCVRISNAAPFCEDYAKLYFDAKHLEKGLNWRWWNFWGPFFKKKYPFFKKVLFLANIERCPKFLYWALLMEYFIALI